MLKFTIHSSQQQKSWSEAHYLLSSGSPNAFGALAAQMASARQGALGWLAGVDRIVVSNYPANRRTRTFTFDLSTPPSSPTNPNQSANLSVMSNNAPLVQWAGTTILTPPTDAPPALYYPAGCFQTLFNVDGPDAGELNKGTPGYTALIRWLNFLSPPATGPNPAPSEWCYRTRNPAGILPSKGLEKQLAAPTLVGVVTESQLVNPVTAQPVANGQMVYLSGWRVDNPRRQNLQGVYRVQSIVTVAGPPATWTYYLWGTSGYQTYHWPIPGNITPLTFTFASYAGYTVEQWVTRKRGGRYDLPLGRSPVHRSV